MLFTYYIYEQRPKMMSLFDNHYDDKTWIKSLLLRIKSNNKIENDTISVSATTNRVVYPYINDSINI